jgi:hypothetical protein
MQFSTKSLACRVSCRWEVPGSQTLLMMKNTPIVTMDEKEIEKIFADEKITKAITCPQAFAIAEKHGIPKAAISEYCNTRGIKIRACQLGCFK